MTRAWITWGAFFLGIVLAGCDCGGGTGAPCDSDGDCEVGEVCRDGHCAPREPADSGGMDASDDAGLRQDAGNFPACPATGSCQEDARCVDGRCIPWGPGGFDDTCVREIVPGPVRPQIQCSWEHPPAGDPYPTEAGVLHTPLVADLRIQLDPEVPTRPNIVFVSTLRYQEGIARVCEGEGTVRVIDGATCAEIAAATDPADRVSSAVTPAIGDLDGDGDPEIVAPALTGGLIAFRWDADARRLVRHWKSADNWGFDRCLWGAVQLADLNDDALPEIIFHGAVWSSAGVFLSAVPGYVGHGHGGTPVAIADVDLDGAMELVAGEGTWQWNTTTNAFELETYYTAGPGAGYIGVADFGDFTGSAGDAPGRPEVALIYSGRFHIRTIGGALVHDLASPGGVTGGPPTIADYDGDGRPEIGAAFDSVYAVYDPDTRTILWSQPSQDLSSRQTGSSVFDFNGDGRAEVVYGDECFVRVYDGPTGDVLFSQGRFSSTWEENAIVADTDGDASAEVVIPISAACSPGYCPEWDPIFAGLRCDTTADCPGGTCDSGYCRCTADADCGSSYGCIAPLAGTPGTGNVCRARHVDCVPGLRVYRDARDRWASSRRIWNQHAYSVTNVNEDGTIPRTSAMQNNWQTAGLNNFRQNVQGQLGDAPGADLTSRNLMAICEGENTRLTAEVCNRGQVFLDFGVEVIFTQVGGAELCRLRTTEPVAPGGCTDVGCVAPVQAQGEFEAIVDPDVIILECVEDNNGSRGEASCLL